jgi:hypothetical protein
LKQQRTREFRVPFSRINAKKTDDRTVISYLFKPLSDEIARAFRES